MRLAEKLEIVIDDLDNIKMESRKKAINELFEKSESTMILILTGYLAALENRSNFRLSVKDVSMQELKVKDRVTIELDIEHDSKVEDFNFITTYVLNIRHEVSNYNKDEFIKNFLRTLKSTSVFDFLTE